MGGLWLGVRVGRSGVGVRALGEGSWRVYVAQTLSLPGMVTSHNNMSCVPSSLARGFAAKPCVEQGREKWRGARACARNHLSLSLGCAEASGWLSRKTSGGMRVCACACLACLQRVRACVCEHVCASMCVRRHCARVRVCVPCQRTCGWSLRQLFRSSTSRPLAIPAIENRALKLGRKGDFSFS